MNTIQASIASIGAGYLIMMITGIRLNRTGKPYGMLIFNLHKLVGVGICIVLFITGRNMYHTAALSSVELTIIWITVLLFFATVTTGSLLSIPISKPLPNIVSKLNKILPYLTVLSTAVTLYLLLNRK